MIRLLVLFCLIALPAFAEFRVSMEPLPLEEAKQFGAVGRVNVAGFKVKGACTGTLIAPDVVLTAAHCVSPVGQSQRVFVAGWERGNYIAARRTRREVRHPAYALGGRHDPRHDIGLLFLSEPIAEVAPVPLGRAMGHDVALVGYHQHVPHLLSGRLSCPMGDFRVSGLLQVACPVTSGNSGGPVLEMQDGVWVLVAVVSSQRAGTAIVVPVSDWVREEMRAR